MKTFLITFVVTFSLFAISIIGQLQILKPQNRDELKTQIARIIQKQRTDKAWMSTVACPTTTMPVNGRRPSVVPDFCINTPDKCLDKCNGKDADACYFLANLIQEHDQIDNDVAEVLYQRSCELGIVSGCTNRAANILNRNEPKGNVCAARTFQKSCSQNDPWGCTMLGLVLGEGIGMKKSVPKALASLVKACDVAVDKNGGACKRANELHALIERSSKSN